MGGGKLLSSLQEGKRPRKKGSRQDLSAWRGLLSARLEGLISILQVPHQPQNPHRPQDSVSSSTWHLRPILPQFWKPLWPNVPSKIVYCPLPRSLPPGTTSLASPIRTSGLLEVGPILRPQPDRPGAGRGRIPRRTGSSLPAPSSLGSPSHCLASVSPDIPTMPHCQPVPPSPRP